MTDMTNIPDRRALGLKDEPYSAYCRVCWQSTYALWIETAPHGGVCPFGASKIEDCEQAMDLERVKGEVKRYVMTADEIGAQRKSWVVGELMLQHPEMTREEAERIYGATSPHPR